MTDYTHVAYDIEPKLPDPAYLAAMPEILSLRVDHLPAMQRRGKWLLQAFDVDQESFDLLHHQWQGFPMPPGVYMGLFEGDPSHDTVWMTDIPREIWTMWDAVQDLRDPRNQRVLITGLGLGVILKHALAQPHVTRVDVIELDSDIIAMVAPSYPDPRVTIHQADALAWKVPRDVSWDYAFHDFWQDTNASRLAIMRDAVRYYRPYVDRQRCWNMPKAVQCCQESVEQIMRVGNMTKQEALDGIQFVAEYLEVAAGDDHAVRSKHHTV